MQLEDNFDYLTTVKVHSTPKINKSKRSLIMALTL